MHSKVDPQMQKNKAGPLSRPYMKNQLKLNLNVRPEIINFLVENIGSKQAP